MRDLSTVMPGLTRHPTGFLRSRQQFVRHVGPRLKAGVTYLSSPAPFVPSEVEASVRAQPRTCLGFARQHPSTSLGTNGGRVGA